MAAEAESCRVLFGGVGPSPLPPPHAVIEQMISADTHASPQAEVFIEIWVRLSVSLRECLIERQQPTLVVGGWLQTCGYHQIDDADATACSLNFSSFTPTISSHPIVASAPTSPITARNMNSGLPNDGT